MTESLRQLLQNLHNETSAVINQTELIISYIVGISSGLQVGQPLIYEKYKDELDAELKNNQIMLSRLNSFVEGRSDLSNSDFEALSECHRRGTSLLQRIKEEKPC